MSHKLANAVRQASERHAAARKPTLERVERLLLGAVDASTTGKIKIVFDGPDDEDLMVECAAIAKRAGLTKISCHSTTYLKCTLNATIPPKTTESGLPERDYRVEQFE